MDFLITFTSRWMRTRYNPIKQSINPSTNSTIRISCMVLLRKNVLNSKPQESQSHNHRNRWSCSEIHLTDFRYCNSVMEWNKKGANQPPENANTKSARLLVVGTDHCGQRASKCYQHLFALFLFSSVDNIFYILSCVKMQIWILQIPGFTKNRICRCVFSHFCCTVL